MRDVFANRVLMNCNFLISACGIWFRASKIRNVELSVEVEEVREGGANGYVHTLVKPASQAKKLVFERGFLPGPGAVLLEGLLGRRQDTSLLIAIYDRSHLTIIKTYVVEGWTVTRVSLSDMDALDGNCLMETVEITYETLKSGVFAADAMRLK